MKFKELYDEKTFIYDVGMVLDMRGDSTGDKYRIEILDKYIEEYWSKPWKSSGKNLKNAYLTDMLQAVIDEGYKVNAMKHDRGWYEFDTNEDYEKFSDFINFN